jgi:hypothetical protein
LQDVEEIGMDANSYANLARRTEVNYHDVAQAFADAGIELLDLYTFQQQSDEIPFCTGK